MRPFLYLIFFLIPLFTYAQDPNLAQQYYDNGEFDKAAQLYDKLYQNNEGNDYFFERYVDCMLNLQQYPQAEKVVEKQIRKQPRELGLYVTYGNIFEKQEKKAEAEAQYNKAIDKMSNDKYYITKLANAFTVQNKYDLAIKTYQRGQDLLKIKNYFAYELGDLYRSKGDEPKMVEEYLNSLGENTARLNTLKAIFQRFLSEEEFGNLQTQLYAKVQENPDNPDFPDLLIWVFLQKKDYKNAFRQAKALDRKMNENGGRVIQIAEIATADGDYDAAISGYDYVLTEKGVQSLYYLDAKQQILNCRRKKVVEKQDYTAEDLTLLEKDYEGFLTEFGRNKTTAKMQTELADLEAFYIKDIDKAIALLDEVIKYPGIDATTLAKAKLNLGDFYLIKGEIWDATLLYSQVDKEFKDDVLGHEARYKNAKLSYYAGDFQWAQAQFDVLKASTSKLISNDAIDMSVFIMDNLGLDTITTPLQLYADAELLVFQNKINDAFKKLDTLRTKYPNHSLEDDIFWLEGQVFLKQRKYTNAADMFQKIVDNYKESIRVDNSLFELAKLYENHLNNPQKAKELYEKIFTDFSGSTFAVDARKEYRRLRGDKIEN